jgi:hypothetical protein
MSEWNTMAGLQPGDLVRVRGADHIRLYKPHLEGKIGLVLDRADRLVRPDGTTPVWEDSLFVLLPGSRPKWWPILHWPMCMERVEYGT